MENPKQQVLFLSDKKALGNFSFDYLMTLKYRNFEKPNKNSEKKNILPSWVYKLVY